MKKCCERELLIKELEEVSKELDRYFPEVK